MSTYAEQNRGNLSDYDRYLAGMDASMKQKVALTAAHLLSLGQVADMGMGSGAGSYALASLYPELEVIGVDVNPTMVELAARRYRLPNLRFVAGDVAESCFEPASLEGILDSSVIHHVTTFNEYDYRAARRCLEVQVEQLADYGTLIVRDFVAPESGRVVLELVDRQPPTGLSAPDLLRRFAREFRFLRAPEQRGFPLEELGEVRAGWQAFALDRRAAAEFLLRKDYQDDWETEVLEEYTYFTQAEFEAVFADLGLRVLASTPIYNPWILRHRWVGQAVVRDGAGQELDFPPTNYLIVGEKVPAGEGVRFEERGPAAPTGFLSLSSYRHSGSGALRDLVRRPHLTVDAVPYFERDGNLFVLVRQSYPRPILTCQPRGSQSLDGTRAVGYVVEPLTALQDDQPLGLTVENLLRDRAGLESAQIRSMRVGHVAYPSPGGILEEVRSLYVEVEPVQIQVAPLHLPFSTAGQVRAIEAQQLLRAAQVGGLGDVRLESCVYLLLRDLGRRWGSWIGDSFELCEQALPGPRVGLEELLARGFRRHFAPCSETAGFLRLECSEFVELDQTGRVLGSLVREFVVPARLTTNTVVVAPVARHEGRFYLGVDEDDLPAAQAFTGNSQLLVAPAWRLPIEVVGLLACRHWVTRRLEADYGLRVREWADLGGRYHPSPGLTPEVVYPYLVTVEPSGTGCRTLHWLDLEELVAGLDRVPDTHLRVVILRTACALGLG